MEKIWRTSLGSYNAGNHIRGKPAGREQCTQHNDLMNPAGSFILISQGILGQFAAELRNRNFMGVVFRLLVGTQEILLPHIISRALQTLKSLSNNILGC